MSISSIRTAGGWSRSTDFLLGFSGHRSKSRGRLARCIGWAILSPLRTMASISSSTDEALHPEFRSIVSLATAHTHKVYFSGPVSYTFSWDVDYQDVWAQLSGTTLSFKTMDEETHRWYENITDLVRPPFHLHYLCDPPKPSSLGRPNRGTR
jgi:hypothetical protein